MFLDEDLKKLTHSERLADEMKFLSKVRRTHISVLMERYDKSESTIKRDLKRLELDYDVIFSNVERQYIKVDDDWVYNKKSLTKAQKEALKYAINLVTDEKIKRDLISIL